MYKPKIVIVLVITSFAYDISYKRRNNSILASIGIYGFVGLFLDKL